MTRITLYYNVEDRLKFLCIFLHRHVFRPRQTALIYCGAGFLPRLDDALWENALFLPHEIWTDSPPPSPSTPILITATLPPPEHTRDILIPLTPTVPTALLGRYPACVDIVGATEKSKIHGRTRTKYYKDNGYNLTMINMQNRKT